jgi:DNA-directed RNA polymerase specialized sigma24 family protein
MAIVIVGLLPLAELAIALDINDPTLVTRAQRYERDAVATLCDRSLDALFRVCLALTGEEAAAEDLAGGALLRAVDGLPAFDGGAAAFHVWLLRMAVTAAAKRRPQGHGTRQALTQLSNIDYELVALRVLAEIDPDHMAPVLNAQPDTLRAWLVTALREVGGRSGTGWGHDLRTFDGAVDEVIGGADPEQAAAHVSAPGDADRLLRTVADLRALIGDEVAPAAATRLRTVALAAAAERRALWVYRNHGVARVPGIEQRRYPSRTGAFVLLGIAAVLAVVVGIVISVLSSFAGPTSSLYPLKRTGENTLLAITTDPVDRAQLEMKLAQTREREGEDMAARGDGDTTVTVLGLRFQLLRSAEHDLISAPVHDSRWKTARDHLFKESDVRMSAIERDLQSTGQDRSAAEVGQLVAAFDADRSPLETELGRPAQPAASLHTAPLG